MRQQGQQEALFDTLEDFDDYTTDLVEGRSTEELIATVRVLPVLAEEEPEEYTPEWCSRLAVRLREHIADRLGMLYADFYEGTRDWGRLNPGMNDFEMIASYAEAKVREYEERTSNRTGHVYTDNGGMTVCAAHAGVYLSRALKQDPDARIIDTPRSTWVRMDGYQITCEACDREGR